MTNVVVPAAGVAVNATAPLVGIGVWFPVAQGITRIPAQPQPVNGVVSFTTLLPIYEELVPLEGRVSVGVGVQRFAYGMALQTVVSGIRTRTGLSVSRILKVTVPAGAVAVSGVTPVVSTGIALRPSAVDVAVGSLAPSFAFGCVVQVPVADVTVAGASPAVSATLTAVLVPAANIAVAGATPDLQAGDDYYSNLAAQVFTLSRDWRVDWWGD